MDWLTFFSNVINSLVWPVAILVIVFLLRDPLVKLVPLLKKLKYKEFELEFSQEVRELRQSVERELPAAEDPRSLGSRERLRQLADISPRSTVLEAWLEVESAGAEAARRHRPELGERDVRNWLKVLDALVRANVVDKERFFQLQELKMLRNRAAHVEDFELSAANAHEFVDVATRMAAYLRSV